MNNALKTFIVSAGTVFFVWLMWFLSHDKVVAILQPKGPVALDERNLILIATALMLAVVIPVFILTAFFAWRYRANNTSARYLPNWEHNVVEELVWWAVPCIIIVILAGLAWQSSRELDPFLPLEGDKEIIEVVALDWKWLFIYPKENFATINYVEFPAGKPVEFHITSDAPMNSFWIPQLAGQIYAMTGMVTKLSLIADSPGTYEGVSANISGKGFAGMSFKAVAVSPDEFTRWTTEIKTSSTTLDGVQYAALLKQSSYEAVRYYGSVQEDLFKRIVSQYDASMMGNMNMHE